MFCKHYKCTLPIHDCLKRQSMYEENSIFIVKRRLELSFKYCSTCKQGKLVQENPESFINKDVINLGKQYKKKEVKNANKKSYSRTENRKREDTGSIGIEWNYPRSEQKLFPSNWFRTSVKRHKLKPGRNMED